MSFWDVLFAQNRPILGLSPMDGVTDAAMRYMTAKYSGRTERKYSGESQENGKTGKLENENGVDLLFTEFVSVDALHHATGERRERLLKTFIRARDVGKYSGTPVIQYSSEAQENSNTGTLEHQIQRPYEIAQVFGNKPELFVEAAKLVESLGFDGIDINMGCPMHKVEDQGSGAGLIRTPELAQEIVLSVKSATKLPVSVKTRIGVDRDIAEEWMAQLMQAKPDNISLHGRTLRQLYQGSADWVAIGRAAKVVHELGGHILGNGDVDSVEQAREKVERYGVDGVLIGRGAEGNPGVFRYTGIPVHRFSSIPVGESSSELQENGNMGTPEYVNTGTLESALREQKIAWMVEHAKVFEQIFKYSGEVQETDHRWFMPMRKHLAWYSKGFPGAAELRSKLMLTNSVEDVEKVVKDFKC